LVIREAKEGVTYSTQAVVTTPICRGVKLFFIFFTDECIWDQIDVWHDSGSDRFLLKDGFTIAKN
jgi:hypothetical protein